MSQITTLIDKLDTFEIVRNKIAQILADESAAQVVLATDAGKPDPNEWKLRVFIERATPWDDYADGDLIVNVWFDTASVDESSSDTVELQTMRGTFNIDVIGFGVSKAGGPGQIPGDEIAALNAQRGLRLVRNILMAWAYTYLDLRGVVGKRMPQSIETFQPQLNNRAETHAVGTRLALGVRYEEFSPQFEPATLQEIGTTIERAEDGSVLAQVDIVFT